MISTSGAVHEQRRKNHGGFPALVFGAVPVPSSTTGVAAAPSPLMTPSTAYHSGSRTSFRDALTQFDWNGLESWWENRAQATEAVISPGERIAQLRALTGLTAEQLGRLFGVSRRSIHNWINGSPMVAHHEERAAKLLEIVQSLPGRSPEQRRAELLDSSKGTSLFHRLVAESSKEQRLQVAALTVQERIAL
jgi:transcriptional regulator with XRE-family HTH domain